MAVAHRICVRLGTVSLVVGLLGSPVVAQSVSNQLDWSTNAAVTDIDNSASPSSVAFKISADAGNCPAGNWLIFNVGGSDAAAQGANAQALVNLLQTANSNGATVTISGFNAGCTVQTVTMTQ